MTNKVPLTSLVRHLTFSIWCSLMESNACFCFLKRLCKSCRISTAPWCASEPSPSTGASSDTWWSTSLLALRPDCPLSSGSGTRSAVALQPRGRLTCESQIICNEVGSVASTTSSGLHLVHTRPATPSSQQSDQWSKHIHTILKTLLPRQVLQFRRKLAVASVQNKLHRG